jgi:TIR domain
MAEDAVRVFISYSHRDELLRDSLATHLSNLQWQGIISSWYDRQLTAGTEWDDKIKTELESADIITCSGDRDNLNRQDAKNAKNS